MLWFSGGSQSTCAQQHLADQKLSETEREGYTLVLAMRRWEFGVFEAWRR